MGRRGQNTAPTKILLSRKRGSIGPRFPGRGILVGAVFWPRRPLIFDLGSIGPHFPGSGILVGAACWPRRPLFLIYGLLERCGSIGPVFWRQVFRSARYAGRIGPIFFNLGPPGTMGCIGPPFSGEWYFGRRGMLAA